MFLERIDESKARRLPVPYGRSIRDDIQSAIIEAGGALPSHHFRLVVPADAFDSMLEVHQNELGPILGFAGARDGKDRAPFLKNFARWLGIGEVVTR